MADWTAPSEENEGCDGPWIDRLFIPLPSLVTMFSRLLFIMVIILSPLIIIVIKDVDDGGEAAQGLLETTLVITGIFEQVD